MEQRLKKLIAKKQQYFIRLQNLLDAGKKVDQVFYLENFKIRIKTLEETKAAFYEIVDEINDVKLELNKDSSPDFQELETVDEIYCNILAIAEKVMSKNTATNANSETQLQPKLPKLDLPSFSGSIRDWPVFYECFRTRIHENNMLSDTDKLHYLIGKLSGKALSVCSGLPPVGTNYEIIWQTLVEKYQDPRILANSYLELILSLKPVQIANAQSLNTLLEQFDGACRALKKLEIEDLGDYILSYLFVSKLDHETNRLFENTRRQASIPPYNEVLNFVKEQAKICTFSSAKQSTSNHKMKTPTHSFAIQETKDKCALCKSTHFILKCPIFLEKTASQRFKITKEKNLCLNCLGAHKVCECRCKFRCRTTQKHHTLLHFCKSNNNQHTVSDNNINSQSLMDSNGNTDILQNDSNTVPPNTTALCSTAMNPSSSSRTTVLLSTVIVNAYNQFGSKIPIRLLLDSGSQANFLTIECAKRLNLEIVNCNSVVRGLGIVRNSIKGKSHLVISSRFNPQFQYSLDVLLINKVSDKLPDVELQNNSFSEFLNLPLADYAFHTPGNIDGIIGAELFPLLIGQNKIVSSTKSPVAIETSFGYVVMGSVPVIANSHFVQTFCCTTDPPLENLVSKFWDIEEILSQKFVKPEDFECEEIYASTICRDSSGRYQTVLPFKQDPAVLGDSYSTALRRFLSLERKFEKLPDFKLQYSSVLREYLDKGYMSRISDPKLSESGYYIPHHGITKTDSTSTPLRCVFDASAKTTSFVSLNDILYTGSKLQSDVIEIFLNFRLNKIAFTADIKQMYLQIKIRSDHRRFQRILWRFDNTEPIDTYELNTVTFGVRSSPFLALRTLQQLAMDEAANYPLGAEIVKRCFYMDDLVCSVPDLDQAKTSYRQLIELFKSGQFDLTKWAVNSDELLNEIPEILRSPKVVNFKTDFLKILGLQWQPHSDNFAFQVCTIAQDCTKRNILSTVAKLFDPLGFLAPFTLLLKLLIKQLWQLKLSWNDPPPQNIAAQWERIKIEFPLLEKFRIPRHIGFCKKYRTTLVGFADSCLTSYGAVVYLRVTVPSGDTLINLVCSKTKVAPMKTMSIPRLELLAAYLLAKLMYCVMQTYNSFLVFDQLFALSDSTVTLCWISTPPYKWTTFVANRVAKIQDLIAPGQWYHVQGKDNISDCLSRGLTPSQLISNQAWINGPKWLSQDTSSWPINIVNTENIDAPEKKVVALFVENFNENPLLVLIERFSNWSKLLRATVYILRFCKLLSSRGAISPVDLEKAELFLIKAVQKQHFSREFELLDNSQLCSVKLRSLAPFVKDDLIRVGGRLKNSELSFDYRHPLLLPKSHHLVNLLIDDCHRRNMHTGPHLVLSILRHKYWILSGRNVVRHRLKKCNYCFRFRPQANSPMMGNLPATRTSGVKPFLVTGVDYAGPYFITLGRRRGIKCQKAYLCVFVCFATKALHLELASDLSTPTFLAAFKRFLARRGLCKTIVSDHGTNFIGAKNELDAMYQLLHSEDCNQSLENELTSRRIEWKLHPPQSPHFSGIWESNIKAIKCHLHKVIGSQVLTYEEMNTVLVQIEAILNSRPLCWLSSDPSEPLALTPAHFLTLTPLQFFPSSDFNPEKINPLDRKRFLDLLVQSFWDRWRTEYLHELQTRQKWNTPTCPIKIGVLVIIRQDNCPVLHWPLGIVENIFPGNDGVVRVASVRTKNGVYKRPVVRLCPLPTQ